MADPGAAVAEERDERDEDDLEGLYGLTDELVRSVHEAIAEDDREALKVLVEPLHAADQADLVQALSTADRGLIEDYLGREFDPELFSYLDEAVREDMLEDLEPEALALVVNDLDTDDALDIIEDLDEEEQEALLQQLSVVDRALYEEALSYPEESAGRLMRREFAAIPLEWNVGQAIDYMRSGVELPDAFYGLFVVGPDHKPSGMVMTSRLLRRRRYVPVKNIMETEIKMIPVTMDQEDVAFLFRQYGLVEAPVIDDAGRIVGVITVDDVVDVIHEEHEEDLLKLGGVQSDDLYEAVADTARLRGSWLFVNLLTAILASLVIGLFQAEIEKIVALAVLMPIVASMGGNAGTQTLTVAVRALAVRELTASNAMRVLGKEMLVGVINGFAFAILMGGIAWFWFSDLALGLVIGAAMIINLIVASLAGLLIPLGLDRAGIDPAIGSSVIVTTVTDVIGFLC
ncbi:MAG: magnesium transporter, partial [Proteobacteria bacterium]|nr:magnesium transporter [Pseudomonadota bacterium]